MRVTIIDDEKILADKIGKKLEANGFVTNIHYGYHDFFENGNTDSELYIIDIGLKDGSGFDIVKHLRKEQKTRVPILMISGYSDTENIVFGLDNGADDYITKPFVPDELVARVRSALRRPGIKPRSKKPIRHNDISFDQESKMVYLGEELISLTRIELRLLECLLENKGKVVSRKRLTSDVWWLAADAEVTDNTINVTLSKLRKKFPDNLDIKTLYNQGYLLS